MTPRKGSKLAKMVEHFKGKEFTYGDMVRFACQLNGRDYDRMESYCTWWDRDELKRKYEMKRANRGYWSVNIYHAKAKGYITKLANGKYVVA